MPEARRFQESRIPGNPLVRFDEGRVGRTQVSPSLLLYRPISFSGILEHPLALGEYYFYSFLGSGCLIRHLNGAEPPGGPAFVVEVTSLRARAKSSLSLAVI